MLSGSQPGIVGGRPHSAKSRVVTLRVFGLTGGIGSGKSTVARRFAARGLPVIDADVLAREVVAPGTPGLAEVIQAFGRSVIGPEGHLDRAALAARVFGDPQARTRLNGILHPRIRDRFAERRAELDQAGEPLACYEAPLLVEVGLAESLRPLVVVALDEELQLARVMARDGATEEHARARIAAQLPLSEKVALADYVIDNRGDERDTLAQADRVLDAIASSLGVDPARYPKP
jgi:dephospho-CoA kinase